MGKKLALKLSFTNLTRLNRCPYLYITTYIVYTAVQELAAMSRHYFHVTKQSRFLPTSVSSDASFLP